MSMSTQEWIAALGLFLTHPELLMATFLGMGAAFSVAWWLRGHFLQAPGERLQNERDAALRKYEQLKQGAEALERGNAELRAQIPRAKEAAVLNPDTDRVLMHMFEAHREMHDFDEMATVLRMERNVLRYHLNQLKIYGFADRTNFNSLDQKIYWRLTSEGLQRAFERKPILMHP